ncbi:hypothetical protein ACP70R_026078 [Stipagrostis hirtigluma subsp. patula]
MMENCQLLLSQSTCSGHFADDSVRIFDVHNPGR